MFIRSGYYYSLFTEFPTTILKIYLNLMSPYCLQVNQNINEITSWCFIHSYFSSSWVKWRRKNVPEKTHIKTYQYVYTGGSVLCGLIKCYLLSIIYWRRAVTYQQKCQLLKQIIVEKLSESTKFLPIIFKPFFKEVSRLIFYVILLNIVRVANIHISYKI